MNTEKTIAPTTPNFSSKDILKMFSAAVGSGVLVSLAAAAIALALASSAQAKTIDTAMPAKIAAASDDINAEPTPGGLFIGGGCESEPITALERDWLVRIDGDVAEVRIMQAFMMPADGPTAAYFLAQLPRGATLKDLKAHTGKKTHTGEFIKLDSLVGARHAEVRAINKLDGLMMWNDQGAIHTDHITHLTPGETITFEYTYALKIVSRDALRALELALTDDDKDQYDANDNEKPVTTSASVWVQWASAKPKYLSGLSDDIAVESTVDGISELSWSTPALGAGNKFRLASDGNKSALVKLPTAFASR